MSVTISDYLTIEGQPSARAYRSSAQSIASGTGVRVQFNAETWDTLGEFDITTTVGRYTATKAGTYQVNTGLAMVVNNGVILQVYIYKNGASVTRSRDWGSADSQEVFTSISDLVELAVNDYIEVFVFQNTGSTQNLSAGSDTTFVSIMKVA